MNGHQIIRFCSCRKGDNQPSNCPKLVALLEVQIVTRPLSLFDAPDRPINQRKRPTQGSFSGLSRIILLGFSSGNR